MTRKEPTRKTKRPAVQSFLRKLPGPEAPQADLRFYALPLDASRSPHPWRISLTRVGNDEVRIGVELHGDVVVGADPEPTADVDLNLAEWEGEQQGVSHRHARLRPGKSRLYILELQSTNGTYVNGMLVGKETAQPLQDGDLITLGRLHLRLGIVQAPSPSNEPAAG